MTVTKARPRDLERPITEAFGGRMLTKGEADEIARSTWPGIDASERVESNLLLLVDEEVYATGDVAPMTTEQVGVLTLLADSLEAAASALTDRAERIRNAAINLYQQAPVDED